MTFKLQPISRGFKVILGEEYSNLVPLEMAPNQIEGCLLKGDWIVLVFAVWSITDRGAIPTLKKLSAEASLRDIHFGIRPFDHYEEAKTWCNGGIISFATPVWILMKNGIVQKQLNGLANCSELVAWALSQ